MLAGSEQAPGSPTLLPSAACLGCRDLPRAVTGFTRWLKPGNHL